MKLQIFGREITVGLKKSLPEKFDSMHFSGPFPSYQYLDTQTAMKFTAVFAAMRLRAESVASLPKTVTQKTSSGKVEATGHPAYILLKFRPNKYQNIFSFWEYTNACLDGWGNAYVIVQRSLGGFPIDLIPIHPKYVTVDLVKGEKWFRIAGTKDFDGLYHDDDILHFFSLSIDGIKGVNPIVYNASAINAGISATTYGNEFFEKKGNFKAVLETEKLIDAKDFKAIRERISSYSDHETPILEGGLKYKSIGIAPEAAQMLQTRTFALQDIARIFNVPPHFIADLSRATFSNIEHQDIQFVKYSLRPAIKRYETELDRKLIFTSELGKIETKFNIDGLLRGDMKSRAEYYSKAIQNGWFSRNEVREMENRNQIAGLDEMLYPSNLTVNGKPNAK